MISRITAVGWMIAATVLLSPPAEGQDLHSATLADRVAQALVQGEAARLQRNGPALMEAAKRLRQLNAAPADGGEDLGQVWLNEARALGVRVKAPPQFRGRILGPAYRRGQLAGHERFVTQQSFAAGEAAEILLTASQKAIVSLEVTDDFGQSICPERSGSARLTCRWLPRFSGAAKISIRNPSDDAATYFLVLN